MQFLLGLSRAIDRLSEWVGQFVRWLVLAAVLISAGNAIMRKAFDISSNAYLEVQWYLFAGVFMLGAGYVFLKNAHVRIDFISSRLSLRTNTIIDILGIVLVIFPLCWMLIELSWPLFHGAWISGETSSNAGGLIRWPVLLLMPVGFALLVLQSGSELIKRIAYLTGHRSEPFPVEQEKTAEELLLEELQAQAAIEEASKQSQAR
ncbi:TRAP transporter small permease subunit [Roseateles sp.]|uniref:TRAP transporter small permease subunit n=1 Tax=Roseateles sp. TaxID=1971397 RepID=UPI003D136694